MNADRNIDQLLDRISLYDLRSYLSRSGWISAFVENKKWQIYDLKKDSEDALQLILPAAENFSDFRERIRQAVVSLSQIEGKTLSNMFAEIAGLNSDSLLIRLQLPSSASSIPIDDAPRHVKAIRNLVVYSACSEIDAKPHYENPLSSATPLFDKFEFCHTFKGSFGFEVATTVAKPLETGNLFEPPKQRKIVERIVRGLILLDEAVKTSDPTTLISSYDTGLNARMCDALAEIGLLGQIPFNFDIQWATSISPSDDVKNFRGRVIGEAEVSILQHVAEQLKIVQPRADEITGIVINLHCVNNPNDNDSRRNVALKIFHREYGPIEVKMTLGPDWYLQAIDAHTTGKQIYAQGQLQRNGNSWSMEAITRFRIVDKASS
ncbi:hypothetical protein LT85_2822 [Collimonas arenae]|uniref:Uncharacterized protein n=1 Tax=Collimonas arenae TaxID=279058 RepID=A0A0A1FDV7_9BURK|nr:hypothetical protein [Collimonas arenae]AIY41980.1 hypothetical protein LT85_2822 [Collimonas arenae]